MGGGGYDNNRDLPDVVHVPTPIRVNSLHLHYTVAELTKALESALIKQANDEQIRLLNQQSQRKKRIKELENELKLLKAADV